MISASPAAAAFIVPPVTFATASLDYGDTITISSFGTPEKATLANKYTYEFVGWYANELFTGDQVTGTVTIIEDLHFYAKFNEIPVNHTITFVTGEGATVIAPIVVGYGQAITAPQNPTKTYYTFLG